MTHDSPRVALTGFAGLDNPEPGLACARALRRQWGDAIHIEGLVYDAWSTGGWTPGVADRLHLVPPLAHGDAATLARVLAIHREHPLDALIPCLDLEVPVYSRLAARLARAGIRSLLPAADDIAAVTKVNLHAFCYANGVPTPRTVHVRDVSAVALHADSFGYPLWVKGTVAGARKVYGREQAIYEAELLAAKWGGGVLLQEAIEGSEHMVAMVARDDGSCLAHVMARKVGRNERGKGVIGAVVDDPGLRQLAFEILSKLHWRGPLELEFVRAAASGRYYLLEINCRFPSWIYLGAMAQANLPALLLKEILAPGTRPRARARVGTLYARDVQEMVVPAARIVELKRSGSASVPAAVTIKRIRRGEVAVGVSGVSAFELTQPGLGVARCLRHAPEVGRLIGLAYTPNDTGLFRREIFDACCRVPLETEASAEGEADERLFDRLLAIRARHSLDVVMPNLDMEIARYARIAGELERVGVRTLLPSLAARRKLSKRGLSAMAARVPAGGLEFPQTMTLNSRRDLDAAWKRLGWPLILKGLDARACRVYTREQAQVVWSRFKEDGETRVLAQATVFGEEFGVGVVCDRQARLIDALPLKKLLMCERGKTWAALATPMPLLLAQLADLLAGVGWSGPADVELIRDAITERLVLIEVNPRFPAWIGYAGLAGVDLPRQWLLAALERPTLARQEIAGDPVFMRTAEEIPASATAMATLVNRGEVTYEAR